MIPLLISFQQSNTNRLMFKPSNILHQTNLAMGGHVVPAGKASPLHAPAFIKVDTVDVAVKHFNEAAMDKYKNDKDFNYHVIKEGLSWWDHFWSWVWHLWASFWNWVAELFQKLFGSANMGKSSANVIKYVILGAGAFAIIYCIIKLLGISFPHLFKKQAKSASVPYSEAVENIHEISFDEAIDDALSNKNYRLAVRLLYLRSLKQLSDLNLINWKIEKTNTAYINELTNAGQREQFTVVTRQFEYVWYGDFPIDGQSYQRINNIFQEFKQSLS
ncbi:DUF4129 domain-containing protein [Mucilaginibacter rubeus]|uniref:DUF4129 domain-containing protein n=2 Tax=Mucilaginibacter rubeus TaxID=2027860 RepID=A0AAE6JMR5_9SPHI|nr:DUF4129 domain-containing protein [Mucilaginibacter rubeus]QEM19925.1 DUF4129 domain-containing protein [Mucilaginibacter gossypii]